MHELKVPAKFGGSYDDGSAQASTPYSLFRKTGTRTRTMNRSDAAKTELLFSSNPSEYHTQSSADGLPCTDAYRMAIEDDEPKDREVWSNVAHWYNKAAEKSPNVGRLYHHLAILARPYTIEQLSLYTRSLTCVTPFESAKGSIMTLFNPILNGKESAIRRSSSFETVFIKAHGILFTKGPTDTSDRFDETIKQLEEDDLLDNYIIRVIARFKEVGVFAAVTDIAAMFEYGIVKQGVPKPILRLAFEAFEDANQGEVPQPGFSKSSDSQSILARPYTLEQLLLYTRSLTCVTPFAFARERIRTPFSPVLQGDYNDHHRSSSSVDDLEVKKLFRQRPENIVELESEFSEPAGKSRGPPPEGSMIRGQLYFQSHLPENWIRNITIDYDEWRDELFSTAQQRIESILWLVGQITSASWRAPYLPVRHYAALILNGLRRWTSSPNYLLFIPFIASCLPIVRGSPISNPDEANEPSGIAHLMPLLAGALYVGSAVAILATARSLATKKGHIRVWVCMMGISAYAWWAVRNDATASASLSITDLGVWAISAFQYGNTTFQEFRIPERVFMLTLLGAVILDMAIVSFMTPNGAAISQSDLLSLSLPAMSLSLAVTANLFGCFRGPPPSPLPSHETEVGVPILRSDPYNEGHSEQRLNIPYPYTSRLYLLGSPLDEDSTRVWEADD